MSESDITAAAQLLAHYVLAQSESRNPQPVAKTTALRKSTATATRSSAMTAPKKRGPGRPRKNPLEPAKPRQPIFSAKHFSDEYDDNIDEE